MGSRSRGKKKASPRVDVVPSERITIGEKTRHHVVEGMVMTPDAHSSGNKSILDISDQKNMYHGYVKGEQVQCRVFQKHFNRWTLCQTGFESTFDIHPISLMLKRRCIARIT